MSKKKGKVSKEWVWNLETYLYMVSLIKQGYNLTQIADKFNITKQSLNPHSQLLQGLGILNKIGLVWEIKEKNLKKIYQYEPVKGVKKLVLPTRDIINLKPNMIRGHAFQFTLRLSKEIINGEKLKEYLKRKNISSNYYNPHKRLSLTFNNHSIRIYPESITIWFPIGLSYFSKDNALAVFERAKYDCFKLIKRLENLLGRTSFTINGTYWIKPSMAHYSLIKNKLAEKLYEEKKELRVRNYKGKEWLIVDNSFQFLELEIQGSGTKPIQQTQATYNLFNRLEKGEDVFQELENEIKLQRKESLERDRGISEDNLNLRVVLDQMNKNLIKLTEIVYKENRE